MTRLGVALGLAALLLDCGGPLGVVPGGRLSGAVATTRPVDWSFAEEHDRCQIETRPEAPRSITASCFSHEGRLYVGTRGGIERGWVQSVTANPDVRVRLGEQVYPMTIRRVLDHAHRMELLRAKAQRFDRRLPSSVPSDHWVFELSWRATDRGGAISP